VTTGGTPPDMRHQPERRVERANIFM